MRLATVEIDTPLGPAARVVAFEADPRQGTPHLIDVTAAGELWWERQGSASAAEWAAATFPPDLARLLRGGPRGL
ncbi:MAG: hypothetical protein ACP5PW_06525, partial [Candidatus Dormibacteria bacterium]